MASCIYCQQRRGSDNYVSKGNDVARHSPGPSSTRPKHSPGLSSAAIQSLGPARAPTQSPDPAVHPTIPTAQPF
ncbi:hypothetical protein Gogos_020926 [Gossypium gossypioides]|uniref:Uncharacterized protein n=1 Tax=Gossypium gossypioides TaxID=34282 RepID=A0A7J9D0E4_GOSGO|nr:hypothetical protein [Gossypium gossypioides]